MSESLAWKYFARFIKLRDTNSYGYGFCIDTGKPIFYKINGGHWSSNCDAGHFITREIKTIMFDENNCHAQLSSANRSMVFSDYRENLISKIGQEEVDRIEAEKYTWGQKKYFELDFEAIAHEYKEKVRLLMRHKMF